MRNQKNLNVFKSQDNSDRVAKKKPGIQEKTEIKKKLKKTWNIE